MNTINNIARIETEENFDQAVQSLNFEKVNDLLLRFTFNEETIKNLVINISDTDLDMAEILLNKIDKNKQKETLSLIKNKKILNELEKRIY